MSGAPSSYDLSNDAALFVAPPFGKLTTYGTRTTFGVLVRRTEPVEMMGEVAGARRVTTLQVVRGALGEVPYDALVNHDGRQYRVLTGDVDDSGWFDLYQVQEDP